MENKEIEKLDEFEEKAKHDIPPCDLENNDYAHIKLNKKDALELKELLSFVLKQLEEYLG